jgi:1,4-alpha-glucan branching enzyme
MDERHRNAFWLAAAVAFAVVCIPSLTLLESVTSYGRFLMGFEPGTLRPVRMTSTPHAGSRRSEPKLDFVEFKLKAPSAKKVGLVGDFNGWKQDTLTLQRQGKDGVWELLVPLPRGRYHYLFVVDGAEKLDPGNPEKSPAEGRVASIKVVK